LVGAQLVCFLCANALIGPEMLLLIADTAIGLLPVIALEARSWLRGRSEGGWVAAGLSVSIGTAAVYVTRLSAGPWLDHIDIAHLLLGVSFALIARGAPITHTGRRTAEETSMNTRRTMATTLAVVLMTPVALGAQTRVGIALVDPVPTAVAARCTSSAGSTSRSSA
jgi:hypothetical protein